MYNIKLQITQLTKHINQTKSNQTSLRAGQVRHTQIMSLS